MGLVGPQSRTAPQARGPGEFPRACRVGPGLALGEQGRLRAVHSGPPAHWTDTAHDSSLQGLLSQSFHPGSRDCHSQPSRQGPGQVHAILNPEAAASPAATTLRGSRPFPGSDFILEPCPALPGSLSGRPWAVGPSHPHSRSLKAGPRALWEWRSRHAPPCGRGVNGGLKPAVLREAQACCSPKSGQEGQMACAPQRQPLPEPLLRNLPPGRQSVVPWGGPGACFPPHGFTP